MLQSTAMSDRPEGHEPAPAPRPSRNLRTAMILLSIALVFFIGVIVNRMLNG